MKRIFFVLVSLALLLVACTSLDWDTKGSIHVEKTMEEMHED